MPRSRKNSHKRSRQSDSVRTIRYPKYTPTIKDLEEPLSFMEDPDFDYSVEDSWKKNFHLDGSYFRMVLLPPYFKYIFKDLFFIY